MFAWFMWTKSATCRPVHTRVLGDFSYCYCLNCVEIKAQGPRNTKTSNVFICTLFLCVFSNYLYFHDAWAHTANMSIFPPDACLLKPVGIDVQTSNSYKRNMFYIYSHTYPQFWGAFQIFRLCMVHVKNSAVCRLAYNKAYIAIFRADACR